MGASIRRLLVLLSVSCVAGSVHAQEPGVSAVENVRSAVRELAFDPAKFFPSPYVKDLSVVRVVYTGDDYGWPVYALAIAEGCVDGETVPRAPDCAARLRARMVRAPAPPNLTRPRQRGSHLVSQLVERGATSAQDIRTALETVGLEWVEADLRTCPGATAALAKSAEAVWVPTAVANPTPADAMSGLVLHADIVQVEVQQFARRSTYRGWIAEDSPAAWATKFASTLEPCWRPAMASKPWSR